MLGVSNQWSWPVERARSVAAGLDVPGYEVLQYAYSYLRPRADLPGPPWSPDASPAVARGDVISLDLELSAAQRATLDEAH